MKYIVEIGSGVMIYIPNFINIGSGIQKLLKEDIHASHNSYITHPIVNMVKRDRNMRFILSRIWVCGYRRGMDWILHLLTHYAHHAELQVITAPPLISILHSSLQNPLRFFQSAVSTAVSWQRLLTVEILQLPALWSSCHSRPCRILVNSLNCQLSTPELDYSAISSQLSGRAQLQTAISRDSLNHLFSII
jgi:hypothetical protein